MSETLPVVPAVRVEPRLDMSRDYESWVDRHKKNEETARAEATKAAKRAEDAEARLAAATSDTEAKLSAAEARANERVIRAELKAIAAQAGIVDPADLVMLDVSKLKLNDKGDVIDGTAAIEAFKKAKPQLFGKLTTSHTDTDPPKPGEATFKHARDMTPDERKANLAQLKRA